MRKCTELRKLYGDDNGPRKPMTGEVTSRRTRGGILFKWSVRDPASPPPLSKSPTRKDVIRSGKFLCMTEIVSENRSHHSKLAVQRDFLFYSLFREKVSPSCQTNSCCHKFHICRIALKHFFWSDSIQSLNNSALGRSGSKEKGPVRHLFNFSVKAA